MDVKTSTQLKFLAVLTLYSVMSSRHVDRSDRGLILPKTYATVLVKVSNSRSSRELLGFTTNPERHGADNNMFELWFQ